MIHALLFAIVFQGLAVLAGCVLLRTVLLRKQPVATVLDYVTTPICTAVTAVTPALWPAWCHGILAIVWLLFLRVVFYMVMGAYGLLPAVPA